jgi:hypothetical protein
MRTPKLVRTLLAVKWQPIALYGALVVLFAFLLWWQLGSLPGDYSPSELAAMSQAHSFTFIYEHPIHAPFSVPAGVLLHFHPNSLLAVRVVSTLFGLLTLSSFFWLVRAWHGQRAAVLGTLVFGLSAWFLHAARLGSSDVLAFGLLTLTACGVWFKQSGKSLPIILCMVIAAAFLYVPGMIWFVIAGVIWQWKTIDRIFKDHLWMVTAGGVLLLAILTPLALAIHRTPQLAKVVVGLPASGWPQLFETARGILGAPLQFVWRGPLWPEHWLGRLPILDAFCMGMLFLGAYVYIKHRKLVRTQLMVVILLISCVLIGLNGGMTATIMVPFVFVLVAAGIEFILERWFTVFPRNPIAQSVGMGLVCLAVLSSCAYGYRHYFVAWPAAPETKAAFSVKQQDVSGTIYID